MSFIEHVQPARRQLSTDLRFPLELCALGPVILQMRKLNPIDIWDLSRVRLMQVVALPFQITDVFLLLMHFSLLCGL